MHCLFTRRACHSRRRALCAARSRDGTRGTAAALARKHRHLHRHRDRLHPYERPRVRNARCDRLSGVLEGNKSLVEQMIHRRGRQQAIFAISSWLEVSSHQALHAFNSGNAQNCSVECTVSRQASDRDRAPASHFGLVLSRSAFRAAAREKNPCRRQAPRTRPFIKKKKDSRINSTRHYRASGPGRFGRATGHLGIDQGN